MSENRYHYGFSTVRFCVSLFCFLTVLTGFKGSVSHDLKIKAKLDAGFFRIKDLLVVSEREKYSERRDVFRLSSQIESFAVSLNPPKPKGLSLIFEKKLNGEGGFAVEKLRGVEWPNHRPTGPSWAISCGFFPTAISC